MRKQTSVEGYPIAILTHLHVDQIFTGISFRVICQAKAEKQILKLSVCQEKANVAIQLCFHPSPF